MYIMGTILRHGTDEQKKAYLPKIATGELRLQAFGVTEPTSGTDTTSLRTFARKEGDKYIVNGQKGLDEPSRALRPDVAARAHNTQRIRWLNAPRVCRPLIVDMRAVLGNGLTISPYPHDDEP